MKQKGSILEYNICVKFNKLITLQDQIVDIEEVEENQN